MPKRKLGRAFGTEMNVTAVGNPVRRAVQRALRLLVRAQARWRGVFSRMQYRVESDGIWRTSGWHHIIDPRWYRHPDAVGEMHFY